MTSPIDPLLEKASVLVVVGPGGVGKTTMSTALGVRAAQRGRRVLVVTVDPARRLADLIGVSAGEDEPVVVPLEGADGRLWAFMVDMARSWDQIVRSNAPDAASANELLGNRLYRTLTKRFAQSHDYIALDHLVTVADDDFRAFELVIVDTPPSVHVLDILDAPRRMIEFFDSWLLKWLVAPYRSRIGQLAAKPFLLVADRVLGGAFVREMAEFFWLFSRLRPGFVRRTKRVEQILSQPETYYVVVKTPEPSQRDQAHALIAELDRRGHRCDAVIVNRSVPAGLVEADISAIHDDGLRHGVEQMKRLAQAERERTSGELQVMVPYRPAAVSDVSALGDLLTEDSQ